MVDSIVDLLVVLSLVAATGCVTQSTHDALALDFAAVEISRDLMEDRCIDYELEIGAWEAQVFSLEMKIKTEGERWEALSAEADEYVSQIEQLREEIAELDSENEALASDRERLNARVESRDRGLASLEGAWERRAVAEADALAGSGEASPQGASPADAARDAKGSVESANRDDLPSVSSEPPPTSPPAPAATDGTPATAEAS